MKPDDAPIDPGGLAECAGWPGWQPLLSEIGRRLARAGDATDSGWAGDTHALNAAPLFAPARAQPGADDALPLRRLAWLREVYALSAFDVDALLLALAPEIDPPTAALYARWHGDPARRAASVALALQLAGGALAGRWSLRSRFAPDAPLCQQRLVALDADAPAAAARRSLLDRAYRVDEQILRFLLHDGGLDTRLAAACRWVGTPVSAPHRLGAVAAALAERLPAAALLLNPHGAAGGAQAAGLAADLAARVGRRLLQADFGALCAGMAPPDAAALAQTLVREAWLGEALLSLAGIDHAPAAATAALWDALAQMPLPLVVHSQQPLLPGGVALPLIHLALTPPSAAERAQRWRQHLRAATTGQAADEAGADALASQLAARWRLTLEQIDQAAPCGLASHRALAGVAGAAEGAAAAPPGDGLAAALAAAARSACRQAVDKLASVVTPRRGFADLVLPADAQAQLHALCQRVYHAPRVLDDWGFGRRLAGNGGVAALFAGPPGSGKTLAAEVVAGELGRELYRVDLSGVVSKYIGETEKNLERAFAAAEAAQAVLLFDEADALFGRRAEVRDAHDRYANQQVSWLLQRMESFAGVAILSTNLRQHLDEAFLRRLAFVVHFPFPDEAARRRLWAGAWPAELPLAADIDLDALARHARLSGGQIRNVALAAAFLGAADGGPVAARHVQQALRRELQKSGQPAPAGAAVAGHESVAR